MPVAEAIRAGLDPDATRRPTAASLATKVRGEYLPPVLEMPFEVAAHHLVYSFVGLVAWYLDAGLLYPPERMGEILERLILGPTYAAAFETNAPAPAGRTDPSA